MVKCSIKSKSSEFTFSMKLNHETLNILFVLEPKMLQVEAEVEMRPLAGIRVAVFIITMLLGIGLAQDASNIRIFQGMNAQPKDFPYMAIVEYDSKYGYYGYCGGSLVSHSVIVTAAHCIDSAIGLIVQLGVNNLDLGREEGRVIIEAQNWLAHPDYTRGSMLNDIGWIILKQLVEFTDFVKPVRMTFVDQTENRDAILTGFGKNYTGGKIPDILQWALMGTTGTSCLNYYNIRDTENNRCALFCAVGASPCESDDGGPLVTFTDNTLIGIVGLQRDKRCHRGEPVIFTKIAHHYRWMKASVEEFNKNKFSRETAGVIP